MPSTTATRPFPPPLEQATGLLTYLTATAGIGGRLRAEPEDFRVIELGDGPRPKADGDFLAMRIRLRNWETNRFVGLAARRVGIKPGKIGFGGMKDKRAVTEQWFTFRTSDERAARVAELEDVEVLGAHRVADQMFAGAHTGNRFILRVQGARHDEAARKAVAETADAITVQGGVPRFFGPQRFGGSFRPVTHLVGAAIVEGDLEEAVRLYLGNPVEGERQEAFEARRIYEETRDPQAALASYPHALDPERRMLERLVARPGDWRHCLQALPPNLLQLFIHAHQSLVFNHVLSARLDAGLGLRDIHLGDRVAAQGEDGTVTHLVTPANIDRVRREVDKGRAAATAPLPGLSTPSAQGVPGEIEAAVLERMGVEARDFRCRELPQVASEGRRRTVLQWVSGLEAEWDGDVPVFSFSLGKGDYATVVVREFMKADAGAY